MDARLQFEWSNEKARELVTVIGGAGFFGTGNEDIVDRDDAEYRVTLSVKLTHKRKSRSKKSVGLDG
jgi:hypothetical protein